MRSAVVMTRALLAAVFLAGLGATACADGVAKTISEPRSAAEPRAQLGAQLGAQLDLAALGCPTPQQACDLYHPGSVPTAWCSYGGCFEMTRSAAIRVVAADDQGDFPRTFFAWHEGTLTPAGLYPCVLTQRGNKTRLDIPDGSIKCRVDLTTAEHCYREHFASNPSSGCLGWVECKSY